jgi:two-component system phosphate regulon sensor histidine kinase PhoR
VVRGQLLRLAAAHALLFGVLLAALAAASQLDRTTLITAAAAIAAAFVISSGAVLLLALTLSRATGLARAVARGDFSQRLELGALSRNEPAAAFNEMVRNLEEIIALAGQERGRLVAALNSSGDAVLAVDAEGRITFANSAAEQLFESGSRDRLAGVPFAWVMADQPAVEALRASREEGRRESVLVERPNRAYLQVITTPITGGGDWAALAVFHDLTDVRRTEQVRRDFVANVSHELRTPLASLRAVIDTLTGGALDDRATARDFIARADAEVDRLVRIVEELLELSRIESGAVLLAQEPVDLGAVLERAVERLRPEAERLGVDLALDAKSGLPLVAGDAERLERAAVNLVGNALKFTPGGGSVRASVALEDGAVVARVRDTGAGIAEEDLPRVFERFYKADRSRGGLGIGLGLAIVRHTIEAHGGSVGVESELGRGSTFTMALPVKQKFT